MPTITLEGRNHAQNVGVTLNAAVGLRGGFVGTDKAHYVRLAAHWADPCHWPELARLRKGLREQVSASALGRREPFVRNLEAVYRKWWRKYCRDHGVLGTNTNANSNSNTNSGGGGGGFSGEEGEEGAGSSGMARSVSGEGEGHSSDDSSQF